MSAYRISAAFAYVPVIGWLYVFFFQRKNPLASFHLRQSIGLVLFLLRAVILWVVVAWLLMAVPSIFDHLLRPSGDQSPLLLGILDSLTGASQFLGAVAMATFGLVMVAFFWGFVVWLMGIYYALNNRLTALPGIGNLANRLLPAG